ncbi:MAG: hypothetical protein ACOY93_08050 [Bacillota bacterium]
MWMMQPRLRRVATGGFPVPGAIEPDQFPPEVKLSILRLLEGPPKPAVTLEVMNRAQRTMLGPDLPYRMDV